MTDIAACGDVGWYPTYQTMLKRNRQREMKQATQKETGNIMKKMKEID